MCFSSANVLLALALLICYPAAAQLAERKRLQERLLNSTFGNCSDLFSDFLSAYGKSYVSATDRNFRKGVICARAVDLLKKNAARTDGVKFGINEYSDLTDSEFRHMYLTTFETPVENHSTQNLSRKIVQQTKLPTGLTDFQVACLPQIKNQGGCGSCWAFAGTHVLESAYYKATGTCVSFSEQQVLDCNGRYGCDGGHVQTVLEWAHYRAGMCNDDAYSYTGIEGYCSECDAPRPFQIASIYYGTNAEELQSLLFYYGSTSIYMFVEAAFQSYMSGVYTCEERASINHAVVAVGFGSDYFTFRNS